MVLVGGFPLGKGFASPAQYRGDDYKTALIRNWRALVTFLNTWAVRYDSDGTNLTVAGDLVVTGNLGANGAAAARPAVTGARDTPEAALANLLSALEAQGYITDSTTAS